MNLTPQLAKQFKDVYDGGNWTSVNLKETLSDITWQQATAQIHSFNSIAKLVYHINYYVEVAIDVIQNKTVNAHDKFSFELPEIQSSEDWNNLVMKVWQNADEFIKLVEQMEENRLWEDFLGKKYGNYYRNISGIIEHTHYHLGQIVLIKKLIPK